tara:strand:+ start:105 stop:419 length:315 start_codon:yes stop_codon:yes gene_type:complete
MAQPGHELRKFCKANGLRVHRYYSNAAQRKVTRVGVYLEEDEDNLYPVVSAYRHNLNIDARSELSNCADICLGQLEFLEQKQLLAAEIAEQRARLNDYRLRMEA